MSFAHSRPDRPAEIDRAYLDQLVQLNVRIPLGLRMRLDRFLDYMELPEEDRSKASVDNNWPSSLQELVRQALEEFLATRNLKQRPGKDPKPPADTSQVKPKVRPKSDKPEPPKHPYKKG